METTLKYIIAEHIIKY